MAKEKLSVKTIMQLLTASGTDDLQVIVEESLPSTNDYILALVANSHEQLTKTAVLAETQTAGKGRQGRSWVSVPGNIMLSLYWPFQGSFETLYGLSLVVGIAIARVLKVCGLSDVQLKWPNDVFWHGKKMGGILIETKQNQLGRIDTVIGIGLNIVDMTAQQAQIDQQFVALEQALQHTIKRDELIAQILVELHLVLSQFSTVGFSKFQAEWQSFDAKIDSNTNEKDLLAKILSAEKMKHSVER